MPDPHHRHSGWSISVPMRKRSSSSATPGFVAKALHTIVSKLPPSLEPPDPFPTERGRALARRTALRAAGVAGTFSLPPGPLGLLTVVPDLLSVWRLQRQMVADIAAAFGRRDALTRETMTLCLFKHGGAFVTHGILARAGEETVVRVISNRTLQQLLEKIAVRLLQRLATKSMVKWLPLVGAIGAGAYVYYDTVQVASNAIELFSGRLRMESSDPAPQHPPKSRRHRARSSSKKAAAG
jgi:hypothetical protein